MPDPQHAPAAPATEADIAAISADCTRLVRRRAAWAAGVAALPLPGLDVVSDLTAFTLVVEEINAAFGLSAAQLGRLQPRLRVVAYEAAAALGGMLVGKVVTRELVLQVLRRAGVRLAAKSVARVVPVAGQLASAAIGYAVFRRLANQHVAACAAVARQLVAARAGATAGQAAGRT